MTAEPTVAVIARCLVTTTTDPDTRFPGLTDGVAHTVAAVVAGLPALVAHLRDGGCPFPTHPESLRTALDAVEDAAWEAEWPAPLVGEVLAAAQDVRDRIAGVAA